MSMWLPNDPSVLQDEVDDRLDEIERRQDEMEDDLYWYESELDDMELDY